MNTKPENTLVESLENLSLMTQAIRQNNGSITPLERDALLEILRKLYVSVLRAELSDPFLPAEEPETDSDVENQEEYDDGGEAMTEPEQEESVEEAETDEASDEEQEAVAEMDTDAMPEEEAAVVPAEPEEAKPIYAPEEPEPAVEPVMEPVMENLEGNPNDDLFSFEMVEEPAEEAQAAQELSFETPEEPETPAEEPEQAPVVEEAPAKEPSLLDLLKRADQEPQPTHRILGETIQGSSHGASDLGAALNRPKVTDLRTVININDKFSFMSDLFHNNMKAYNDFILRLNSYSDREQALEYVHEVAAQYSWNEDSLSVKNFYNIFDRKF